MPLMLALVSRRENIASHSNAPHCRFLFARAGQPAEASRQLRLSSFSRRALRGSECLAASSRAPTTGRLLGRRHNARQREKRRAPRARRQRSDITSRLAAVVLSNDIISRRHRHHGEDDAPISSAADQARPPHVSASAPRSPHATSSFRHRSDRMPAAQVAYRRAYFYYRVR